MEFDAYWDLVAQNENNNENRWHVGLMNVDMNPKSYNDSFYHGYLVNDSSPTLETVKNNCIFEMGLSSNAGAFNIQGNAIGNLSALRSKQFISSIGGVTSSNFWNTWLHVTIEVDFDTKMVYVLYTYDNNSMNYIKLLLPFVDTSCTQATTFVIDSLGTNQSARRTGHEWLGLANMSISCSR